MKRFFREMKVESLLDLGCGIRPFTLMPIPTKVSLDAYLPYLRKITGHRVQADIAYDLPFRNESFDVVWMSDVIEHLPKQLARMSLREALRVSIKGVAIRTPLGFVKQETDAWEMGGEKWQTHRSGWYPQDFEPYVGAHTWLIKPNPKHRSKWYHDGWFATWIPRQ